MLFTYILIVIIVAIEIAEGAILAYLIYHNKNAASSAKTTTATFTVKKYDVTDTDDLIELREKIIDNIWLWYSTGKDIDEIAEMIYNNIPNPCICCNSYANDIGGCAYFGKGSCKETGIRQFVEQAINNTKYYKCDGGF